MKAAFLIRCSTKNQDLSRQTSDLTRLAISMGYEYDLDNLVYGEKITGKDNIFNGMRESLEKLLKGAKEQKFDVVLVSEVSRLSRDPLAGRKYLADLIQIGIPVYFKDIKEWSFEPNTIPSENTIRDRIMEIGTSFDAAWKYLKSMKTQIASARRNQLDNGAISVGKPFFGYKWRGGRDKLTKTQWVIDEDAREVVVDIFNEYLREGATLKSTSLAITAKYGEKFGKKFNVGTIEHILLYESYSTGIKKINLTDPDTERVEVFEVQIPAIIPTEIFKAAESKRTGAKVKREPYPSQATHILSRLIKCPCCGYSLTPKAKGSDKRADGRGANGSYRFVNGKKAMSWICMSGINNTTDCANRMSIANEKLEPIIWELVKNELIYFANLNEEDREQKIAEIEEKIATLSASIINYDREKDKLDKKIDRAYQLILDMDDEDMVAVAMAKYKDTVKSAKKEQTAYQKSKEEAIAEIENLTNLKIFYSQPSVPSDVIEQAEADPTKMRELVLELVKKIVPYKITTFQRYRREKGKAAFKELYTVKNGVVLLEVDTVNGIYYVLYNANGSDTTKYAYYLGADIVFTGSDFATDYVKSLGKELFYISSPYLYFTDDRANDMDAVVDVNTFIEIAKENNKVLAYPYKPEK